MPSHARSTITAILLLTACGEPVQNAPQPGDTVTLPPIEWRVRDRAGLDAAYRNSGMAIGEGDHLSGFAGRDGDQAVVYTLPPERRSERPTTGGVLSESASAGGGRATMRGSAAS